MSRNGPIPRAEVLTIHDVGKETFPGSEYANFHLVLWSVLVLITNIIGAVALQAEAGAAGAPISGTGSSFASPAIETWVNSTTNAPYSLSISWSASNSGQGRYEFTSQTTDFAVSDIGYFGNTDTTPPTFPFDYVPIVGEGVAYYYNIPGLTQQLQLTSYTACAILTGGITNWDDPAIAAAQPRRDPSQPDHRARHRE